MTAPRIHTLLLASTALLVLGALPGSAGPDGPVVVGGQATVTGAGSANVQVNQTSNSAIINWNTFNIGAGQTTTFVQPGTSSVALNRVTGGLGPSEIYGTLNANGHVFLINPDGVLVGPSGVINTAGFLATTSNIRNEDFMAGRYTFNIPGRPDASIVNQGNITATSGGFAALVAPGVRNTGTITATLGTVALVSGNTFTLDLYGDKLIQLAPGDEIGAKVIDVATKQPLKDLVSNSGRLSANGGRVELTAAGARAVVDSVINNTGVIEANSIGSRNGKIVLGAATQSTKPAGAPVQTVKLSGTISAAGKAKGTKGGTVVATGENIVVTGAKIDASGVAGGGKVMLGGDWAGGNPTQGLVNNASAKLETYAIANATTLSVDAATTINASATGNGQGGKVVLWSDSQTTFAGTIFARGGANGGDGGFVEVSGKQQLAFTGKVDTSAPMGKTGDLLLDPANITISSDPDTGGFAPNTNNSVINVTTLQTALATNNVTVTTSAGGTQVGDITVATNVTWASNSALTLSANHDIIVNNGVTITNTGAGNLNLRADSAGTGVGTVTFQGTGKVDFSSSTGLVSIFYNPADNPAGSSVNATSYTTPTNYSPYVLTNEEVPRQLNTYMLVNSAFDLQNVQNNLSGTYALGKDIDASGTANWTGAGFVPIGNSEVAFSGKFDGQGHIINGLSIAGSYSNLGLFGVNSGTIQNVGLSNVTISATGTSQFVGALVGSNNGTITNAFATGTVGNPVDAVIQSANGAYGGLVGLNNARGTISQSYATVAVHVTGPTEHYIDAGGLVGQNQGLITQSYANGAVSGTYTSSAHTYLGGLVGWNLGGTIQYSYATSSVTGGGAHGNLGGLVGMSDGGTINPTFASGTVTIKDGSTDSVAGGLIGSAGESTTVTSSYWDKGTTGQATSAGGAGAVGLSSEDALKKSSYVGWNFSNDGTWFMIDGQTRPFLRSEYSTTINNGHQLQLMTMNTSANYVLGSSFNIGTELANPSGMWSSQGFVPIGVASDNTGQLVSTPFTGQFDGQGKTITGLTIALNDATISSIGLFSTIGTTGVVSNLNLASANVSANPGVNSQWVGVLAGSSAGTIKNVSATGTVNGTPPDIHNKPTIITGVVAGGLVGQQGLLGDVNHAGSITNSHANVTVTVGDGCAIDCSGGFNAAGGLVGANVAGSTITNSYAQGNVTGGGSTFAGGLAGYNGFISPANATGSITNSYATGNVTVTGLNAAAGGLVGSNGPGSTITDSQATGIVASTSNAGTGNQSFTAAGGLVGQNAGTITSTTPPTQASACVAGASSFSCATGMVSVGAHGSAGGLVGGNSGFVTNTFATGAVIGASGAADDENGGHSTQLGGLVGQNQGTISHSFATGNVGTQGVDAPNVTWLVAGGLVGDNSGMIQNSFATGNVRTGDNGQAGGLVGSNSPNDSNCYQCTLPPGYSNAATISDSSASGTVTVGANSVAGGLAGAGNGIFINTETQTTSTVTGGDNSVLGGLVGGLGIETGSISNSIARGAVTGTGSNSIVGGLVGLSTGTITNSSSSGAVTGKDNSYVGGLIGVNYGLIDHSNKTGNALVSTTGGGNFVGGLVGMNSGKIDTSTSAGNVTGAGDSVVGGLVGVNATFVPAVPPGNALTNLDVPPPNFPGTFPAGTIVNSSTSGMVTVTTGNGGVAGGLVGNNGGTITGSSTAAIVGGGSGARVGGLVGVNGSPSGGPAFPQLLSNGQCNDCRIIASYAMSTNQAGSISGSNATGLVSGGANSVIGGLVGVNPGTIMDSFATGNVTGTGAKAVGGFVGWNQVGGTINSTTPDVTYATGNVSNTGPSFVGGFAGANDGTIALAYATGSVTNTSGPAPVPVGTTGSAPSVYLGGFVGYNTGTIDQAYGKGAVTGGDNSAVGGFVGLNLKTGEQPGSITHSYALGPVTTGAGNSVAASFAALNLGSLDQTYGTGLVTGGAGSKLGGLVAVDQFTITPPSVGNSIAQVEGPLPTPQTISGTTNNSYWDRQTTGQITSAGGTGVDTAVLAGGVPAGWDASIWAHGSYPHLVNLGDQNTEPGLPVLPPDGTNTDTQQKIVDGLNKDGSLNLTTIPDVVNTQAVQNQTQGQGQQGQGGQQGPGGQRGPGGGPPTTPPPGQIDVGPGRFFFVPPPGETRYDKNTVVLQIDSNIPLSQLQQIAAQLGMTITGSQPNGLLGKTVYQFEFTDGSLTDKIHQLAAFEIITHAAPQYLFQLTQDVAGRGESGRGDAAQYMVNKLALPDLHRTYKGGNIPIAVVDSEIDADHPDLTGAISERYNATGVDEKPHPHGTGMAGAIGSHRRLVGTAPAARILAIRAFSTKASAVESTSFNILKGLDYAVSKNVRIVNMSFAGPRDPSLERALKSAYDKGVVLVAAAGNAGPRSPPLYPAADPHVIAVTATDMDDKLFSGANRGRHLTIAAPGVDILVPAPEGTYQMTTGTSVATAHVSGVVALMLERNPQLTPADVRRILMLSAKKLGPNDQFGAGLIDPGKAIQFANPRSVELMNAQPSDQVAGINPRPAAPQRQASVGTPAGGPKTAPAGAPKTAANTAPKTAPKVATNTPTTGAKAAPKTASAKSEPKSAPPSNAQPAPARWLDRWGGQP